MVPLTLDVVLEMDPTSVSEGEKVTLRCRTNCTLDPITAFSWYKNGQSIPNSNIFSPVYILFSVSSEDTGRYSFSVEGHEDPPSAEETLTVTCKYIWDFNVQFDLLTMLILEFRIDCFTHKYIYQYIF